MDRSAFPQFPKKRPPLPAEIQEIYAKHYRLNRDGKSSATSVAQRMERWLHFRVADDVAGLRHTNKRTLELGAGTLNQLVFEPESEVYDVVEPFTALFQDSVYRPRISNFYTDISEVPSRNSYDRITSIAVLEHVCDLPMVVSRCVSLLADGGVFRASIPSEGTILWKLGWMLTTGVEFRLKYGLDYGQLMRHEHVNTADEIEMVLRHYFSSVQCRVFGLSKRLSFYRFYECKDPSLV